VSKKKSVPLSYLPMSLDKQIGQQKSIFNSSLTTCFSLIFLHQQFLVSCDIKIFLTWFYSPYECRQCAFNIYWLHDFLQFVNFFTIITIGISGNMRRRIFPIVVMSSAPNSRASFPTRDESGGKKLLLRKNQWKIN
jgi:hypothetical protein